MTAAWALDANVRNAFNNKPANVNALLLAYMQYAPLGTGSSHDYSSVLELNENNAPLTGNGLVVGLLTPQLTGSGLQPGDSLRFRIQTAGDHSRRSNFIHKPNAVKLLPKLGL